MIDTIERNSFLEEAPLADAVEWWPVKHGNPWLAVLATGLACLALFFIILTAVVEEYRGVCAFFAVLWVAGLIASAVAYFGGFEKEGR